MSEQKAKLSFEMVNEWVNEAIRLTITFQHPKVNPTSFRFAQLWVGARTRYLQFLDRRFPKTDVGEARDGKSMLHALAMWQSEEFAGNVSDSE